MKQAKVPSSFREQFTLPDILYYQYSEPSFRKVRQKKKIVHSSPTQQIIRKQADQQTMTVESQKLKTEKGKSVNIHTLNDSIIQSDTEKRQQQFLSQQSKLIELLKPSVVTFKKSDMGRNSSQKQHSATKLPPITQNKENQSKCRLCFQYLDDEIIHLSCKHNFHKYCLKEAVQHLIKQGAYRIGCSCCQRKLSSKILRAFVNGHSLNLFFLNQIKILTNKQTLEFEKCQNCFFFWVKSKELKDNPVCQQCE